MFVTRHSHKLINDTTDTCQASSHLWRMVYLESAKGLCIGTWGTETQTYLLTANTQVLREAIQESFNTPLMSLAIFLPSEDVCVLWNVHNIVRVWQCYCIEDDQHLLIFEDDAGEKSPPTSAQTLLNEKVIWTSPAYSAYAAQ